MAAYVVVEITIHDPSVYDSYKTLAPASIARYGGRYLVRGGTTTTLEGGWDPQRLVILEFPDAEKGSAWWHSAGYAEAKAMRQSCATTRMVMIDGPPFDPAKAPS